jgi:hypothetical protein
VRAAVPAVLRRRQDLLWLALVVATASAGAIVYVLRLEGYFVMPDELTYQREMLAIARSGRPVLPGEAYYNSLSQLMPVLHAPVWGLASSMTGAFAASHVLNALVFASAAIPVHLLVRRVTGSGAAGVVAGAATVAVPWFAMSGTLMTEPVAYTAFAWAILALHRAVVAPSVRGDLIGLAGVLVAIAARSQLVFLLGVLLAAVVVREVAGPRVAARAALRRHVVLVAALLLGVAYLVISGSGLEDTIGNYTITTRGDVLPAGSFAYGRELLTSAALACAGITLPITLGWALGALRSPEREETFACALVLVLAGVAAVVVAGTFSVRFTAGQNDRYIQYLAPLLFTGTAAGLTVGPLRVVPTVLATAATAWVYVTSTLAVQGPSLTSPGSAFRTVIDGRSRVLAGWFGIDAKPTVVVAVLVALGVLALLLVRRVAPRPLVGVAVAVAVLVYGTSMTAYTMRAVARTQQGVSPAFLASRGWADRAVPDGQPFNAMLDVISDEATSVPSWWDAIFYNREVRRIYTLVGAPSYEQSAVAGVSVDDRTGELQGLPGGYLLVAAQSVRFGLRDARTVDALGGVRLVRTAGRPRVTFALDSATGSTYQAPGADLGLRIFTEGPVRLRLSLVARVGPVGIDVLHGRRLVARRTLAPNVPVELRLRRMSPERLRIRLTRARRGAIKDAFVHVLGVDVAPVRRGR